jgi:hypothetical protein
VIWISTGCTVTVSKTLRALNGSGRRALVALEDKSVAIRMQDVRIGLDPANPAFPMSAAFQGDLDY